LQFIYFVADTNCLSYHERHESAIYFNLGIKQYTVAIKALI